jgi:hypothetical protein
MEERRVRGRIGRGWTAELDVARGKRVGARIEQGAVGDRENLQPQVVEAGVLMVEGDLESRAHTFADDLQLGLGQELVVVVFECVERAVEGGLHLEQVTHHPVVRGLERAGNAQGEERVAEAHRSEFVEGTEVAQRDEAIRCVDEILGDACPACDVTRIVATVAQQTHEPLQRGDLEHGGVHDAAPGCRERCDEQDRITGGCSTMARRVRASSLAGSRWSKPMRRPCVRQSERRAGVLGQQGLGERDVVDLDAAQARAA